MEKFVINIGRQLGSGGRAIGHLLSDAFGIAYYDKEILTLAAQESGFSEELFVRNDERKGFFRSLFTTSVPLMGGNESIYSGGLSEENLFHLQSEAIRKAASDHSCIFIGRCADYVLRDYPRCVNVFVSADMPDRVARLCHDRQIDERTAARLCVKGDDKRAAFYNFYSAGRWGEASTYHLCINSSVLGIEGTAAYIKDFVERRLALLT